MTLAEAPIGTPARITGFAALAEEELARLFALGLRPDVVVTKLFRTPLRVPIECLAGSQLLAVEGWLMERILVAP